MIEKERRKRISFLATTKNTERDNKAKV